MDPDRFDALSRPLIATGSRRRAVAAVGGALGLLGLAHPDEATAAKSGKCKPKCGACEKCKRGDCDRKDGRKRCKKGKCQPKADGAACAERRCCGGACVDTSNDPRNCGSCDTRCQVNAVCSAGTCACVRRVSMPVTRLSAKASAVPSLPVPGPPASSGLHLGALGGRPPFWAWTAR